MLLAGLKCKTHGDVPLTHFDDVKHTLEQFAMPLPWLAAIVKIALGDERHAGNKLTVTRLLTCPRETVIHDNIPVHLDPFAHNSLEWGNAMHAHMEQNTEPGKYPEVSIPPPGEPAPIIFGVPVTGHVDLVSPDFSLIEDYKGHSENAQRYVHLGKLDVAAQFNIYRIGIAKSILKVDPPEYRPMMVARHGAAVSASGPPAWIPVEVPYMAEEEIASYRPKGGGYTVQQIVSQYVDAHAKIEAINQQVLEPAARLAAYKVVVKSMPLAGREMMRGKKCIQYCTAAEMCDGLEGIIRA